MSCGASTRARGGRNPISAASRSLLLDRWSRACGFRHLHAIPKEGEFGADTREEGAWRRLGGANVWSIISADEDRAFVTVPYHSAHLSTQDPTFPGNRETRGASTSTALAAR